LKYELLSEAESERKQQWPILRYFIIILIEEERNPQSYTILPVTWAKRILTACWFCILVGLLHWYGKGWCKL